MMQIKRSVALLWLTAAALTAGCMSPHRKSEAKPPRPMTPARSEITPPQPKTPAKQVSQVSAKSVPAEVQIRARVEAFIASVHKKHWAKSSSYFAKSFRKKHRRELLDGSLLGHVTGKSLAAILEEPTLRVTEVKMKPGGATVRCLPIVKGGGLVQVGMLILDMVQENGKWMIKSI